MNKIVLEHYPAGKLPKELRGDLPADALVTLTVEPETERLTPLSLDQLRDIARRPTSPHGDFDILAEIQASQAEHGALGVSMEEAVTRIRQLRDEWDS